MATETWMCHDYQRPSWYARYPDVGEERKMGASSPFMYGVCRPNEMQAENANVDVPRFQEETLVSIAPLSLNCSVQVFCVCVCVCVCVCESSEGAAPMRLDGREGKASWKARCQWRSGKTKRTSLHSCLR